MYPNLFILENTHDSPRLILTTIFQRFDQVVSHIFQLVHEFLKDLFLIYACYIYCSYLLVSLIRVDCLKVVFPLDDSICIYH